AQFDKDPNFSTGYDYTVAKILANEMLRIYLNQRLQLLEKKQLTNDIKISLSDFKLKWTGTKSEAIEWGYGLFAAKTLNYGNATIKEVMAFV
ncbi:UNVERIFIED_CONTAM: RteC domain-containing protein, partial [Prevotella sp. 15_C9]